MSFGAHYAIQAYAKVGVETGVSAADPHRLVLMLFEGAIAAVIDAKRHMTSGAVAAKGEAISKAIMIVDDGLSASLDVDAGGALAQNLRALYAYMSQRLLLAGAKNQPELLDEVRILLGELKDAWASIKPQAHAAASVQPTAAQTAPRPY